MMSVAETLPLQAASDSHQSLQIENEDNYEEENNTDVTERPLSTFEKSLFALVSGYVLYAASLNLNNG